MEDFRKLSTTSRFSSPGTPKIRSTPSFSSAATRRSDPFGISILPIFSFYAFNLTSLERQVQREGLRHARWRRQPGMRFNYDRAPLHREPSRRRRSKLLSLLTSNDFARSDQIQFSGYEPILPPALARGETSFQEISNRRSSSICLSVSGHADGGRVGPQSFPINCS